MSALPRWADVVAAAGAACGAVACAARLIQPAIPVAPLGVTAPSYPDGKEPTARKIALGRLLFFDERLSRDGSMSCASCHDPDHAFAEPDAVSHGLGRGARRRNTPSVLNSAFESALGWDSRFSTLEEQILGVFSESGDMGVGIGDALAIVRRDAAYDRLWSRAFGRRPDLEGFTEALAAFQRSLLSGNSRLDRYLFAGDSAALSESERRGLTVFRSRGCAGCHKIFQPGAVRFDGSAVSFLTDRHHHNLGVGYENGRMADAGRYEVTGKPMDFGRFKTPSLRNVALTAPYMHDGSLATLEEVIEFYDRGGILNPNLDSVILPKRFSAQDKADLVALLRAMTSEPLLPDEVRRSIEETRARRQRR
jgi:cytochrome c peroxidase